MKSTIAARRLNQLALLPVIVALSLLPYWSVVQAAANNGDPKPVKTIETKNGKIEVYDTTELLKDSMYQQHEDPGSQSSPEGSSIEADSRVVFDRISVTWIKNVQTGQVVCGYVRNTGWVSSGTAEVNEQSDVFINFAYVASTESSNINSTSSSTSCYNGGAGSVWQGDGASAATWLSDGAQAWSGYAILNTTQPARL